MYYTTAVIENTDGKGWHAIVERWRAGPSEDTQMAVAVRHNTTFFVCVCFVIYHRISMWWYHR